MKTITASKADPTGDEVIEGVTIVIDSEFPKKETLIAQMRFHQDQAEEIALALALALPQATLSRLAIQLMSLYIGCYQGRINLTPRDGGSE